MSGRIQKHHATILAMRAQCKTNREIAAATGCTPRSIGRYITRAGIGHKTPVGSMNIRRDFSGSEIAALGRLAAQWGCATLAEAAVEILKDALAEAEAQEAAE